MMNPSPPVPRHIGIIMDGNGRWAKARSRPATFGHRAGVRSIKRVMYACEGLGVEILSVYAFSTENWSRPRREVSALMRLFHETLRREFEEIDARGVRIVVSGRREELSSAMLEQIEEAERLTASNRSGTLNVCLNYGGRAEVVDAVRGLVAEGLAASEVDEEAIRSRLYVPHLPEPDLIIRTAGERRVSNFLLWQSAYAEFYATDTLWPDFDVDDLREAITDFQGRVRRFGRRVEKEAIPTQPAATAREEGLSVSP